MDIGGCHSTRSVSNAEREVAATVQRSRSGGRGCRAIAFAVVLRMGVTPKDKRHMAPLLPDCFVQLVRAGRDVFVDVGHRRNVLVAPRHYGNFAACKRRDPAGKPHLWAFAPRFPVAPGRLTGTDRVRASGLRSALFFSPCAQESRTIHVVTL